MLVIQELYVDATNFASVSYDSEVVYSKQMFIDKGFVSVDDVDAELEMVLNVARKIADDRNTPDPYMHNPGTFNITMLNDICYTGCVTESGNVFAIQTRLDDDEVYQSIGYRGTRGRYLIELEWMRRSLERHSDCGEYKDIYSLFEGVEPEVYQTSGPADMFHYEDALAFAIRMYEQGDKTPVQYWLKKAIGLIAIDKDIMATSLVIINYLKERDGEFAISWDNMVCDMEQSRARALDVCYSV